MTGASGMVGSALLPALVDEGHEIIRFVRRLAAGEGEAHWQPDMGVIDADAVARCDAIIHLAGEPIAGSRWSPQHKEAIRTSRVDPTKLLAAAIRDAGPERPTVLLCASAVGYYGHRGGERLTEGSNPGSGFLAETCQAWEAAADVARAAGVRVVHLRTGVVLAKGQGALAKMELPFKLGVGGRLGSGTQYMSWIHLRDCIVATVRVVTDTSFEGPVNIVAPEPVTNAAFTRALARALKRPALVPVPAFVLRATVGELADEALLASQRVVPRKLTDAGFEFAHPEIEEALTSIYRM